jgi:hypothetical protein
MIFPKNRPNDYRPACHNVLFKLSAESCERTALAEIDITSCFTLCAVAGVLVSSIAVASLCSVAV